MTTKIQKANRGFTLIELVTVIMVLAILGGFTFSFLDHAIKTYTMVKEQDILYTEGAYIMERVTKELSDAATVTTPSLGAMSSTLTFTRVHTSSIDTSTTVTFAKSGRNLLRNSVLIGRNVNKFDVTRHLSSGALDETVVIELEITSPRDPTIPPFSITTEIAPNNYGTGYTGRSFNGDYFEYIN